MAKIYKVTHSDSLLNPSDNDSRYVGIRSNAAEKWIASPFNSSYIEVEEIDAPDGLNEVYKSKYSFIFIINPEYYKDFLKVAKSKRDAISYRDLYNEENFSLFKRKIEKKGFQIDEIESNAFKLSSVDETTSVCVGDVEVSVSTVSTVLETQDNSESEQQLCTKQQLTQLRSDIEKTYAELEPSVQNLLNTTELEKEILTIESAIDVDTLKNIQERIQVVQQKFLQQYTLARSVVETNSQEYAKAVNEIISIKKEFKQDGTGLARLELGLNQMLKKSEQMLKGLTSCFFSSISREKHMVLCSVSKNWEILHDINTVLNRSVLPEESNLKAIKSKFTDINEALGEENLKILKKSRGFTFFGLRKVTTTSDQIALEVKAAANALEEKIDKLVSQVSIVNSL